MDKPMSKFEEQASFKSNHTEAMLRASPPVSTDGLVEELREPQKWCCIFQHEGQMRHGTSGAPFRAADRIEQLTATLADRDAMIEAKQVELNEAVATVIDGDATIAGLRLAMESALAHRYGVWTDTLRAALDASATGMVK